MWVIAINPSSGHGRGIELAKDVIDFFNSDYNPLLHSNVKMSTGLYNSASFMNEMLNDNQIESKIEEIQEELDAHNATTEI